MLYKFIRSKFVCNYRRVLLFFLTLLFIFPIQSVYAISEKRPKREKPDVSYNGWTNVFNNDIVAEVDIQEKGIHVDKKNLTKFNLDLQESGSYALAISYHADEDIIIDTTLSIWIDNNVDQSVSTQIYSLWQDETKDYSLDRYGNEVTSQQIALKNPVTDYVYDSTKVAINPSMFLIDKGSHFINFLSNDVSLNIYKICLVKLNDIPSSEEYHKLHKGKDYTGSPIVVEGENYSVKSDSFIRSKAESNSGVYPYSPYYKWMATVDGNSWKNFGQRIMWNVTVPSDGWYSIFLHYSQSYQEGQEVYRTVEVDGQTPSTSLKEIPFPYTGSSYSYKKLPDKIWLTAGTHTFGMLTQSDYFSDLIKQVQNVMQQLSDIGLNLQKVAGNNADKNRVWDIESYIPGITSDLQNIENTLNSMYDSLMKKYGKVPASSLNLKLSSDVIKQVLKKPEKLPTCIDQISVGSGSITELLANLISKWKNQGLSLNRIYFSSENEKLNNPNGSSINNIINKFKKFFWALTSKEASYNVSEKQNNNSLSIWVNRSIPYVETMQMLADSSFKDLDSNGNPISVQFSVMPDESKLLLANASNTSPDVALSVTGDKAYQLGIRNAVSPISDFSDFPQYILNNFIDSAFESYIYNGKVYGFPETQQFYVLMYRKDIIDNLRMKIPNTWDELADLMPELRRDGMNFYMPLSSQSGTKSLSFISPFYFQSAIANGQPAEYSLWSKNGNSVSFNNENGIEAFQKLTDLYLIYGVQNNIPSFYNNFRYGVTPLGIGSFENYVQMLYAAPEIAGKWSIAPALGFKCKDGSVSNAMTSSDRSIVIMSSSKKKEEGWKFIKWWMSDKTQIKFQQTLQSKFGAEFVWNSANLKAFEKLGIPSDDKNIILDQWKTSINIRYLPANYMLQRNLSDAWYQVTQGNKSVRIALNEAGATVDQELLLKLQEFGYIDNNEVPVRDYDMKKWKEILSTYNNK